MDALGNVFPVLLENSLVASTSDGTMDIDLRKYYVSPGNREIMATFTAIGATVSCSSCITKFEEASSSASADYADITGATFTLVTDIAINTGTALQTIWFGTHPDKPFLRCFHTVSAAVKINVQVFLVKRVG